MLPARSLRAQGRSILITGAGSGIGQATALMFGEEGAHVFALDVQGAEGTARQIADRGGKATAITADVTRPADWDRAVTVAMQSEGRIDVLANVAGVVSRGADTVVEQTEDEWDRILAVNLKGVWLGMKAVLPLMIGNGGGKIVNVASLGGVLGLLRLAAYSASKGGVVALTRQAAIDYASHNVQINSVSPGIIETPILAARHREGSNTFAVALADTPAGRLGFPKEVAAMIVYLASSEADYITGQNFVIDGGRSAH